MRDTLLVLAIVVVLGAAILVFGLVVADGTLVLAGGIVLAASAFIALAIGVVASRAALLRKRLGPQVAGTVVFHASVMAPDATWLRGHGRLAVAVADREGIEVHRGRPLEAEWVASWDEVRDLTTELVSVGRQLAPALTVHLADGTQTRLLLRGDHGLHPGPDYAAALLGELQELRR